MLASSSIDYILELGLYSLWIIPFLGVFIYCRLFIDRYVTSLKTVQMKFETRMAQEEEDRNAERRRKHVTESLVKLGETRAETIANFNIREMKPEERINFAVEQGMILNVNVPTSMLKAGFITGNAVTNNNEVLLPAGSYLTGSLISKIVENSVSEVCIMLHPDNPLAERVLNEQYE